MAVDVNSKGTYRVIVCSLYGLLEVNTCGADGIRLFVCLFVYLQNDVMKFCYSFVTGFSLKSSADLISVHVCVSSFNYAFSVAQSFGSNEGVIGE
jgi:hypothetical protein